MALPSSFSTMLTANDTSRLIEEANRLTSLPPYCEVSDKINLVLGVLKISKNLGRNYEDNRVKVDLTYSSEEPHYKLSISIKEKISNSMNTNYASFTGAKFKLLNQADIKKIFEDLDNK
jgi:hypothetical protein